MTVAKSLPPVGFTEKRICSQAHPRFACPSHQLDFVIVYGLHDHPELVDEIRIVFAQFRRMDRTRTRPGMRTLLRHRVDHQVTRLIVLLLQLTNLSIISQTAGARRQFHCDTAFLVIGVNFYNGSLRLTGLQLATGLSCRSGCNSPPLISLQHLLAICQLKNSQQPTFGQHPTTFLLQQLTARRFHGFDA